MRNLGKMLQIGLTFMGTVVGAGFASGQEILQFFTRFGFIGAFTILLVTVIFIWLGAKMMLLAAEINAVSYEDLNRNLFGERLGQLVSIFMMIVLLGVSGVMLAGAGSIFLEHLNISYQTGLLLTLCACFFILRKGLQAILTVNSIVAPIMLLFTIIMLFKTLETPSSGRWLELVNDYSPWAAWTSPFLYTAYNLSLGQAVLVPVGAKIKNRSAIIGGAWIGGIGIGFMLLVGHITLSANMPGITQYAIPMGGIAKQLGQGVQWIFIFLIFSEIFTSLIANAYGLTALLQRRLKWRQDLVIFSVLFLSFLLSQFGFGTLLSTLYPIFGLISLGWMALILRR
ncbi:hypothetical protein ACFOQM_09825 [Paenibacillus sp. GCM10012307]|uniref:Uncharacterized protein n=1 Tax=Paenibacillus roseus TaxID=2798579 RepID=A0A934J734_9BACL|nr:hypothetical protein [Paenibacillus roseus]MBJ6361582.1 hypothetical protein [Paenibacillus roseus]